PHFSSFLLRAAAKPVLGFIIDTFLMGPASLTSGGWPDGSRGFRQGARPSSQELRQLHSDPSQTGEPQDALKAATMHFWQNAKDFRLTGVFPMHCIGRLERFQPGQRGCRRHATMAQSGPDDAYNLRQIA